MTKMTKEEAQQALQKIVDELAAILEQQEIDDAKELADKAIEKAKGEADAI